jgi:uncharacterized membrane protein
MQNHPQLPHSRTQFQIDRIAFFSDAVIAIASTLMILEIKIPELGKEASLREIFNHYGWSMLLHGLALFVAFWTIGNLWMRHHQLFDHIVNYNERLIRINLYFLFTVMLLPISISFLFADNEPPYLKMLFYFGNLVLSCSAYSLLLSVVYSAKNKFSNLTDKKKIDKIKESSYVESTVFLIALILILLNRPWFWVAFLIIPLNRILSRIKTKVHDRKSSALH